MKYLQEFQKDIVDEGTEIIENYNLLYLILEQRLGKTAISLKICQTIDPQKKIYFFTKKAIISSIKNDIADFNVKNEVQIYSIDSIPCIIDKDSFVIIDQAHSIGQFPEPSKRHLKLKQIINKQPVIYLSGTIMPQSACQIFHQLSISKYNPFRKYQNFESWAQIYTEKFYITGSIKPLYNPDMDLITRKINHICIKYTRKEAGFSEHSIKQNYVRVSMEHDTLQANKLLIESYRDYPIKLNNFLHQLCGGTMVQLNNKNDWDYSKAKYINEHFISQNKLVIFYKYKNQRRLLENSLNWKISSTPQQFNSSQERVAYLCQFKSNSEGINLSSSNIIIFYNVDYSCSSIIQSLSRTLSIDKKQHSQAFYLLSNLYVQDKILEKVNNKIENIKKTYEK